MKHVDLSGKCTYINYFSFLSDCTWNSLRFDVSASYQAFRNGSIFGWYQWPAIKKLPKTRDLETVTRIKISTMETLEIFSIFAVCCVSRSGGHVVSSIKSLGLWFILPASVEPHSPPFGQFTSRSCDLQWAIVGLDQGVHVTISPFRWVEGSHSLLVLGTLGAWVPQPLSHSLHRLDFVEGNLGCLTRLFHSLHMWIFLNDQLRTFGSFTLATVQSAYITHREFRKNTASFRKTLEPIISLRHIDFALITALTALVSLCIHYWAILSWQRSTVLLASGDISSAILATCPSHHSLAAHHAAHDLIQLLCLPSFQNLALYRPCDPTFW